MAWTFSHSELPQSIHSGAERVHHNKRRVFHEAPKYHAAGATAKTIGISNQSISSLQLDTVSLTGVEAYTS